MVRVRLVVAWVLIVLVQIQGLAAGSKVCCAMRAEHDAASDMDASVAMAAPAIASRRDPHVAAASHNNVPPGLAPSYQFLVESGHDELEGCGLCASLCHDIAISQSSASGPAILPGRRQSAHGFRRLLERPFSVADKPPRA